MKRQQAKNIESILEGDEVDAVLKETFYTGPKRRNRRKKAKAKPDHYDVICISMYKEDLTQLDKMVARLKKSGHRKMSRSALIRYALDQVDVDDLPRTY